MRTAPYGAWPSPVSAAMAAASGVRLSEPWLGTGGSTWWLERRPSNAGHTTLVRDGEDVTSPETNVRTRVHEYGGGALLLHGVTAFFSEYADQRLYRLDPGAAPRADHPRAAARRRRSVTPTAASTPDGDSDPLRARDPRRGRRAGERPGGRARRRLGASPGCSPRGPTSTPTRGSARTAAGLLAAGTTPTCPGTAPSCGSAPLDEPRRRRAWSPAGRRESICQPEWCPDGRLHFVSDRDGWWNLYRGGRAARPSEQAELGYPQWLFGGSTYASCPTARSCACACRARWSAWACCDPGASRLEDLGLPYDAVGYPYVKALGERVVAGGRGPDRGGGRGVLERRGRPASGAERQRRAARAGLGAAAAHARVPDRAAGAPRTRFFYPPRNPDFEAPEGELPPLIVQVHGGPTAHATPTLDLRDPVLDQPRHRRGRRELRRQHGLRPRLPRAAATAVGRRRRRRLRRRRRCTWPPQGEADGERLAIRGGSAGGYTTLLRADLPRRLRRRARATTASATSRRWPRDTHKFESRYLDRLIGPYPERARPLRERSPIHHVDQLTLPVILFQGLEDEVVPPNQAETMVAALRAQGLPHAYLAFEGEQHGFRKARDHRALPRGRAVLLRPGLRLRAGRRTWSRSTFAWPRWAATRVWMPTSPASPAGSRRCAREVRALVHAAECRCR